MKRETVIENGIRNTIISFQKEPTDTIFAYCDEKDFNIEDLFKQDHLISEEKENVPSTVNQENTNKTTIKKIRQGNLGSFFNKI